MLSRTEASCYSQIKIRARSLTTFLGRASFLFSFPIKCRASLTAEASLVLPLFLLYMLTLLYSLEMVRFQSDVRETLHQEAIRGSFAAYAGRYGKGTEQENDETEQNIREYLGNRFLSHLCVEGDAEGVSVTVDKDIFGKDNRRLTASYTIKPFAGWLPIGRLSVTDSVLAHDWTGYQNDGIWDEHESTEVYVYITSTGKRYHLSEACGYLKIKLQAAGREEVSQLRNASGNIYYPCEMCGAKKNETVYLTEWGTSYHGKPDCSGIKRTIYIVPLSQAREQGRTLCSKCG